MMSKGEFEGKWKQIRGQARQWWSKLTDDDLDRVGGKLDSFIALLQDKYGYPRTAAEEEFTQRMAQFVARQRRTKNLSQAATLDIAEATWQQMHAQAREWWSKLSDDELVSTGGKAEALFGLLQAEYGYSRERAEAEFIRRVKEYQVSQQANPKPETLFT